MRTLSDIIAHSRRESDDAPVKPLSAILFVATLLLTASAGAYWIGATMTYPGEAIASIAALGY